MNTRIDATIPPMWQRLIPAGCVAAIALCAAWAFAPLREHSTEPSSTTATWTTAEERGPFDLAAFSAPIWYVAPPPPAPEPAHEPPRLSPFNLELVAIIESSGGIEAVFYDPGSDTLIHVSVGETLLKGRIVDAIDSGGVQIREASGVRTVALDRSP